jgi:hypothetical protein
LAISTSAAITKHKVAIPFVGEPEAAACLDEGACVFDILAGVEGVTGVQLLRANWRREGEQRRRIQNTLNQAVNRSTPHVVCCARLKLSSASAAMLRAVAREFNFFQERDENLCASQNAMKSV